VRIWLPKARKLKHLTVKLTGKQEIGFPEGLRAYEATTILEKELSLVPDDQDSLHLDKGEHTFAFTLAVPSNTPSFERCQYGKVRHFVTAKAKGLHSLGSDLLSAEKPIYLICNVSICQLEPAETRFGLICLTGRLAGVQRCPAWRSG